MKPAIIPRAERGHSPRSARAPAGADPIACPTAIVGFGPWAEDLVAGAAPLVRTRPLVRILPAHDVGERFGRAFDFTAATGLGPVGARRFLAVAEAGSLAPAIEAGNLARDRFGVEERAILLGGPLPASRSAAEAAPGAYRT